MAAFAWALATNTASAGEIVPYQGWAAGKVTGRTPLGGGVAVPNGDPFLLITMEATGNFSHVGKVAIDYVQESRLVVNADGYFLVSDGTYVVTAANGDTLVGTFVTTQNYVTGAFTTEVVIEDGTGRFAGATGVLSGPGQYNAVEDTFAYTLEGVISTVGSSKRKR